ncbi:MAG: phytanoyl-CoA dioxygenase family protein [Methylovulum sp.]|nr:phytanoyl-CoA dioxygenase family protein [Methylovulum sp.]
MMKSASREQLEQQGYCIARNLLDQSMIEKISQWCDKVLEKVSEYNRTEFKAQGCLVDIADYPDFAEVIGHEALAALFNELDFGGYVLGSGSVVSKPPNGPALFWHQDWWGWDDLLSYSDRIPQVNVMIYLSPTSPGNGCLRVIPGSHHQKHPLHQFPVDYSSSISRVENPDHPLYQSWEGECAITVQPGDIVVKDTRLLHSTYANASNVDRTMLSLNFNPDFSALPASMQARIKRIFMREIEFDWIDVPKGLQMSQWPDSQRKKIEHLFPVCADDVPPQNFNFSPNLDLLNGVEHY